jgi:DNA invertase Pin-like site-specific DNA recombinase
MHKRVALYARSPLNQTETEAVILRDLRQAAEARGDTVVATYLDDDRITGRGKHAGWRKLIGALDQVDQVAVADAGDLPGRTVGDLLRTLSIFRGLSVTLHIDHKEIDTASTGFAMLDIITAYRAAKRSAAIRIGQARALAAGKRIGRPMIPDSVLVRIQASLASGGGIRPTARRFGVSPATVINVRHRITNADLGAGSQLPRLI